MCTIFRILIFNKKNKMKKFVKVAAVVSVVALSVGLSGLFIARAATKVSLGSAGNFAVLAGSTITNTGSSVVNGDLGLNPGTSVTGFPAGVLNGTKHIADANTVEAQVDLTAAYLNAAGQTPVTTIPSELGGSTKIAGIYDSSDGKFSITGTLTLDGQGNPGAVFIFKTASTLITDGASNVSLINGAQACNVFWQVGSSATLGTNSVFKGNILALTSATLTTGANVEGRVLARNGAVTLDSSTITKATCAVIIPTPVIVVATSTPVIIIATTTPTTTAVIIVPTSVPTSTPVITLSPVVPVVAVPVLISAPSFPNAGFDPTN